MPDRVKDSSAELGVNSKIVQIRLSQGCLHQTFKIVLFFRILVNIYFDISVENNEVSIFLF